MVNYREDASYDIINYVWEQLKATSVLDPLDYHFDDYNIDVVPFAPVQENPEFANRLGSLPYMIYEVQSAPAPSGSDWWRLRDQITLTIFATDFNDIVAIKNVIMDKLRRMDESARAVNGWVGVSGKYNFHCIEVFGTNMSGETESEAGRVTGEVVIAYDYVRYLDSTGSYL